MENFEDEEQLYGAEDENSVSEQQCVNELSITPSGKHSRQKDKTKKKSKTNSKRI